MHYQTVFKELKIGQAFQNFCIPVFGTNFVLSPIRCVNVQESDDVVKMLTTARNLNSNSFLTSFEATTFKTAAWLNQLVGQDHSRILFSLVRPQDAFLYGYMGLAFASQEGNSIEGDAIVRFASQKISGLMRKSFRALIDWAGNDLGFREISVRVLSDNPAIHFYHTLGFIETERRRLFQYNDKNSGATVLAETSDGESTIQSSRTLSYLKLLKT